ncbi:MAG TPA: diaminopimelate decarboxylase [Desulfobacteraceae bacterium]|nr:diaminopimelate decarboxylase [Desulfobacteraceae bacterium]
MNHFTYCNNELYCESINIAEIAQKVGTPFYLYSHATLKRHFTVFNNAFSSTKRLVCYSAKANSNLAVLKLFQKLSSGLDIVSGGELYKGLKAGFSPDRIVYSGVGKRIDEIDYALSTGILMFNVESMEEMELINERGRHLNLVAPVSIRVNPDVDPKTHPYISTGLKKNKFGIDIKTAIEGYKIAAAMENIKIVGIDCHIGSQITQTQPFADALESVKQLIYQLKKIDIKIKYLDIGGGLGITYDNESPPEPKEYADVITKALKDIDVQLILEPGRVLVGNAGILVTKVLYKKENHGKNFIVVDAGMNDLLRPAIYKAFHSILPVVKTDAKKITADIVGPICETGDFLATDCRISDVSSGDLLAVMSAGAYGFTMSSNYCSRLKLAEVMVSNDKFNVIKTRQNYEDLVQDETIPQFI